MRVTGSITEGDSPILRFGPLTHAGQLILQGDVEHWSIFVYDETERNLTPGAGTIRVDTLPLAGHWVRLDDGLNIPLTYEIGVSSPSSPYDARAVTLGVDEEATRDNLVASIEADRVAGFLNIEAEARATDVKVIDLTHIGEQRDSIWPVKKSGNSLIVTGMDGYTHYQRVEASPLELLFATAQTSDDDPGWGGKAPFSVRYIYDQLTLNPLLGGRRYRFEIQLKMIDPEEGVKTLTAILQVDPRRSPQVT